MAEIREVSEYQEGRKYLVLGGVDYDVTDVSQEEQEAFISKYVQEKTQYKPVEETK